MSRRAAAGFAILILLGSAPDVAAGAGSLAPIPIEEASPPESYTPAPAITPQPDRGPGASAPDSASSSDPGPDRPPDPAVDRDPATDRDPTNAPATDPDPVYETTVKAARPGSAPATSPSSSVFRSDLERRLPRSAPDALLYEPGVFVQQTAHGQGSAFIRGLTGQQTLLLFDGIRLNNSTYRQGPNQYFFTLDSRSLDSVEIIRGGASTRFGSDAIGGVLLAHPREPGTETGVRPSVSLRGATADEERGGRLQLDLSNGAGLSALIGGGARRVGQLTSGGAILGDGGLAPDVPRFASDGRTQLGTGFDELTADARLVWRPGPEDSIKVASYLYRQYDSPRTDQCPPTGARHDECLVYEEQFRTLIYGAWDHSGAQGDGARATVSWQRQHERRAGSRPASFVINRGLDDVDTFGVTARAHSRGLSLSPALEARLAWGADTYLDLLRSSATIGFSDLDVEVARSRGQYLDGSRYLYGGAFVESELQAGPRWSLNAGSRLSWIAASAPADAASGSSAVERAWFPLVGRAGVQWKASSRWSLLANLDHSYRAPNLDDLTSRQQTGPGFQFENPELRPERATTLELGSRLRSWGLVADAWVFATRLTGAVGKRPRDIADCPIGTPQCETSWSRFQLVNATSEAWLWGIEGAARARLPWDFKAKATLAFTWGEGPNLADRPSNLSAPYRERVPLSRVPPLNGTVEVYRGPATGFGGGVSLRWAASQDRLAVADLSDARIPLGGTPGFAVLDIRASYRFDTRLLASVALENLFDVAYRYHGSSVNGPGRGLSAVIEASF